MGPAGEARANGDKGLCRCHADPVGAEVPGTMAIPAACAIAAILRAMVRPPFVVGLI